MLCKGFGDLMLSVESELGVVKFDFLFLSLKEACRKSAEDLRASDLLGEVQTMATRGAYACAGWKGP